MLTKGQRADDKLWQKTAPCHEAESREKTFSALIIVIVIIIIISIVIVIVIIMIVVTIIIIRAQGTAFSAQHPVAFYKGWPFESQASSGTFLSPYNHFETDWLENKNSSFAHSVKETPLSFRNNLYIFVSIDIPWLIISTRNTDAEINASLVNELLDCSSSDDQCIAGCWQ